MEKEKIEIGERIASAYVMFLASFTTATVIWLFILLLTGGAQHNDIPSFSPVLYFSVFFTLLSLFVPKLSLNIMAYIWGKIAAFIKAISNY